MFCTDEHRLGLKPVLRSVWTPKGERPTALGHHRFQWLYVTAFVGPATGETVWYLTDTVSKPLFADLLDAFVRAVGAGPQKRVVLLLDSAGWHTLPNLAVPDGLKLVYLPAPSAPNCTLRSLPQPASQVVGPSLLRPPRRSGRRWTNPSSTPSSPTWTSSSTLTERCSNLSTRQPEISSRTNFAWWPKNQAPL